MSVSNTPVAATPDGFENVVRGMILKNNPQQPIESEASRQTSRQPQEPAMQISTPEVGATPLPNDQRTPSIRRGPNAAPSNGRPQNKRGSSTSRRPQSSGIIDAPFTTERDVPAEYTLRQARQPRRRQNARSSQASTANPGPATVSAGLSIAGTSLPLPQSQQQPSHQLCWTPPAALTSHAVPPTQSPSHRGSQPRQLQHTQPRNLQQGTQRQIPPSYSYGRPPPQHQRLYDPNASSQQPYHHSPMLGRQSSGPSSSQSRHLMFQAQIDYLDSMAQLQVPKATISSEEEHQKEDLRQVLEDVCQQAITEYEVAKEPLFDSTTVSLKCFGSLRTGFATRLSDMDLALGSPNSRPDPALPESEIPRVLEKALLDLGYGARLLTRTRVPIIRFCEIPTPELAVRLREERSKWEKEEDAAFEKRKAQKPKAESKSSHQSKTTAKDKKSKEGKGEQSQENASSARRGDEQLDSEKQKNPDPTTSGQAKGLDDDPPEQAAPEDVLAEEAVEKGQSQDKISAQDEDVTTKDQRACTENPGGPVISASSNVVNFAHDETKLAHDYNPTSVNENSHGTNSTDKLAIRSRGMSVANNADPSKEIELGQTNNKVDPQALQNVKGENLGTDKSVTQAPEPQSRLESTLPDVEIVRLYKLAIKEGWFEPKERTTIFAYIKAVENHNSQNQLDACRSQLLALPDVLNRYRPPPEHHLDFPKDGVGVQCDINFSNRLALHNSHMLRCYNLSDPRVRPMVLFVKAWAKRRKINSPYHGTLSSYGYVLMVLHFLINIARPPICLNLQTVEMAFRDTSFENTQIVDGHSVRFWRDEKEIQQWAKNSRITADHHSSVGSLLRGFFQYFAVVHGGFSWANDVLSLRTVGGILSKRQKDWIAAKTVVLEPVGEGQKGQEVRQRYLFAIEDPFEINHNIARTVVHNGIVAIRDEFRRANKLINDAGTGRITEDFFEEAEAKDDLNYRHFGPRPRPPQQTKADAPASGTAGKDGKQASKQASKQAATSAEQPAKQKKPSSTTAEVV
ncbi:MAG: hypothetical protein Q9168_001508 [Polycauliona sp. 1 TL-2023]